MRKLYLVLCLCIVGTFQIGAQSSPHYEKIKKELKAFAVYDTISKYKSGALKFKGSIAEFDTENYTYYHKIGKFERYYRKGSLMRISHFDSFGTLLNEKFYDPGGGLFCEYELIEIDTSAKSAIEFLESDNHLKITSKEKKYRYSIRWGVTYLFSEGICENGKKIGVWKFYDPHGNLKKEKNY